MIRSIISDVFRLQDWSMIRSIISDVLRLQDWSMIRTVLLVLCASGPVWDFSS